MTQGVRTRGGAERDRNPPPRMDADRATEVAPVSGSAPTGRRVTAVPTGRRAFHVEHPWEARSRWPGAPALVSQTERAPRRACLAAGLLPGATEQPPPPPITGLGNGDPPRGTPGRRRDRWTGPPGLVSTDQASPGIGYPAAGCFAGATTSPCRRSRVLGNSDPPRGTRGRRRDDGPVPGARLPDQVSPGIGYIALAASPGGPTTSPSRRSRLLGNIGPPRGTRGGAEIMDRSPGARSQTKSHQGSGTSQLAAPRGPTTSPCRRSRLLAERRQ